MDISSSNDHITDASYPVDRTTVLYTHDDNVSTEFLSYFESTIIFLQHFGKHTSVHEIKTFLASFEQKADNQIYFLFHRPSRQLCLPPNIHSHFPLQFGNLIYGTLCVKKQIHQSAIPAFPLKLAYNLSQLCGWLLNTLEQSMFIWSYQQPEFSTSETLTKREREVLTLMCHGHNLEDIAHTLNITSATVTKHKQHIYSQLGVHNERDALHVSYHYGLVSFLDELYE